MIFFWAIAAAMLLAALAIVLPPLLLRRHTETVGHAAANLELLRGELERIDAELHSGAIDRGQWEANRREIERRVLEENQAADAKHEHAAAESSPRLALLIGVLVPVTALSLYLVLGDMRALTGEFQAEQDTAHAMQREKIEAMVNRLAEKMKASPDDPEGWAMLGRSYAFLGRMPDAVAAYGESLRRRPDDARLLADYADTLGAMNGGTLKGEPERIIQRALKVDPNQPKALALAGTIAFNDRDFAQALKHWERAMANMPEGGGLAGMVSASIEEARAELAKSGGKPPSSPPPSPPVASGGVAISGTVTLAPGLAAKAAPDSTVFVFARTPDGSGPPLAILRAQVRQLPLAFKLDDSMSMGPAFKLSSAPRVIVTARVSKSGSAAPQPGDLEGASTPVAPGASGVAVRIDKER